MLRLTRKQLRCCLLGTITIVGVLNAVAYSLFIVLNSIDWNTSGRGRYGPPPEVANRVKIDSYFCPHPECKCDANTVFVRSTPQSVINDDEAPHRLCVVIPYRDVEEELSQMVPYMQKFLKRNRRVQEFYFIVISQDDKYRFNKGSLFNVGFFESKKLSCDYMAMHDVDLLPLNDDLDYGYPEHGPYHPTGSIPCHSLGTSQYLSECLVRSLNGIFLIRMDHFESVNGMSNLIWGWGHEDDEIYRRLCRANMTIFRPVGIGWTLENTLLNIHRETRKRDLIPIENYENQIRQPDEVTGLRNVKYEILGRSNISIGDASVLFVNVSLSCDKTRTPWCEIG